MSSNGQAKSFGDIAVSVRGVGKSYTIRHNAERHTTLAEALASRVRRPFRRQEKETFWAPNNVSFDIKKGEVVGIIGRNGAGKSTLLKILSRITSPTVGEIDLYGRVGSLLEAGTGFHPELTGRENIFLNGAILGMSKSEIRHQFNAIVEFAEVERFLDTPVKRYSSGMYVRLAFAVAAHLNPEILIIDEVLAAGDAEFQKKCLGKMKDVAGRGRTVLFVSHNLAAVSALCDRGVVLAGGELQFEGPASRAIEYYSTAGGKRSTVDHLGSFHFAQDVPRFGSCRGVLQSLTIIDPESGLTRPTLAAGVPAKLILGVRNLGSVPGPILGVRFRNALDVVITNISTRQSPLTITQPRSEAEDVIIEIPALSLAPGRYSLDLIVKDRGGDVIDAIPDACRIEVSEGQLFETGYRFAEGDGVVFTGSQWQVVPAVNGSRARLAEAIEI